MKITPLKVVQMTLFFIVFSILFSCSKDTDLLLDSVLNEPVASIEEKESATNEIPDEEGFVIRTFAFSPTNDAYLQDAQGHDRSIVRLQEDYRTSYLMFDLSKVNGPITDAVLQFSVDSDEGDGTITVNKGSSNEWTEKNLTENNAPVIDAKLGAMNKAYKVGAPEKIALSATALQSELTTLVLTHSTGNDLAFASKEHPTNKGPLLIITYKAPEGSPEIESQDDEQEEEEEEDPQPKNDPKGVEKGYFVTTSGKASNDGLSEATAWSIEYAFERAVSGDVVHIKAGNYGNKELVVDNSGTAEKPIRFVGYTNSPGDLVSNQKSTFNYGEQVDPNKMPLLVGNTINNEGQGNAITITEKHITIENLQITKFKTGIGAYGGHSILKNIIVTYMGDFNPAHTYPTATSNHLLNYSGNGIVISGNGSELHNSFALNCGAQAITFNRGNEMFAKNNTVYADNTINPTDYYFSIAAGTTNSSFINTKIVRVGELQHHGHGISLKGNGVISGNTVDGFEIINTFLELQFPKTSNNIIKNGTIIKEQNVNNNTDTVGGLKVANGSHNNTYKNIELTNCSILFMDWKDGLAGDINDASDNNIFDNITVRNANSGIAFSFFQVTNRASSADNNTFLNCKFVNLKYLFERDRANSGTKLINCTINDVENFAQKRINDGPNYSINATYQNCSWTNINFTPPN